MKVTGLYGHIQKNATRSALLLAGFVVLISIFWYCWCVIFTAISSKYFYFKILTLEQILGQALDRALVHWLVPVTASLIWFVIAYFTHALLIRAATGARTITRKEAPDLYNVVENLAITAGLPMPRVEVMWTPALNAYAAGLGHKDAVICVTSGLLQALDREELEAVIAHEMTHIKNHDVRLMVVASVFTGGLTLVGDAVSAWLTSPTAVVDGARASTELLSFGSHSDTDGETILAIVIAVVTLGLTHLFSLMSQFAISRSREFMADAGAIELTKNPEALISALRKVAGNSEIEGLSPAMMGMMILGDYESYFATHPPLEDRVDALKRYGGATDQARARRSTRVRMPSRMGSEVAMDYSALTGGAALIAGRRPSFGRRR